MATAIDTMTRYEYRFERIALGGFFLETRRPEQDYHRIVEERARDGWRLVQVFAPSVFVLSGGTPEWFELIFERPVD